MIPPRAGRPGASGIWRPSVAQEVDEELAFHVEMRTREFVAGGMTPAEARAAALRGFGDYERVRRTCRDLGQRRERGMRRAELIHETRQDARYALRTLRRSPAFTAVAVATLALGLAANTAIFSVVDAVLLRPLPYAGAERLVVLWNSYASIGMTRGAVSPAEYADYRQMERPFEAVGAVGDIGLNLTGRDEPVRLQGYMVTPNFFRVLGVRPLLGRAFLDEEGTRATNKVVVLSHDVWRRLFGADRGVVGQSVRLNGLPYTVVGVMAPGIRFPDAPGFLFPEPADVWIPYAWELSRDEQSRGDQFLRVIARLRPAVTPERLRQELATAGTRWREQYPDYYPASARWSPAAVSMREQVVGDVRPALLVLLGAVGLVLLIACANVASLLLARATARAREIALRMALGATRSRVVRQLLTESLVLAVVGGALGLVLAAWGVRALVRLGPPSIPRLDEAGLDLRVLAFTAGATVLTALLFGLAPALQRSRGGSLHELLKQGGRGGTQGASRHRLRRALVAAEVALAVVVLVGAGLLLRSFVRLQQVDPGFRPDGLLTMQLSLPRARYERPDQMATFYRALLERLAAISDVRAAAGVRPLPLSGDGWSGSFLVEGQPVAPGEESPHGEYAVVTPDYFQALGIPLRAGRFFTDRDAVGAPLAVIVDEALARRYWPGQDPLGKRINTSIDPDTVWSSVVGVVGHVRSGSLQSEGEPQIYLPFFQRPRTTMAVVVRGRGAAERDPIRLAAPVRAAVRAIDREQPIAKMHTMGELVERVTARQRFNLLLLSIFAAAALLLAAVGIYGVMSYTVAQRTSEIGIRMALGARPAHVLRLVVGQGMRVALAGIAAGIAGAALLSRAMAGLLFGIRATDVVTYAGITVLLAGVALVASYIPARRATRIDPLAALRSE